MAEGATADIQPEVTPAQQAVDSQSQPEGYDYDTDLLSHPEKALEVAKKAQSEKDRIAGEYRQLKERAGELLPLIEQGMSNNAVSWLRAYNALRQHPEYSEVVRQVEMTGQVPAHVRRQQQRDDSEDDYEEPWQKALREQQQLLQHQLSQVNQRLTQLQSGAGVEKFRDHVTRFFQDEWPDLTDEDRQTLNEKVEKTIREYGKTATGAQQLLGFTYDQTRTFLQGQLQTGAMERALDRKRQRIGQAQRGAATDVAPGVRTTGLEPDAEPKQRFHSQQEIANEALAAFREASARIR